MSQVSRNGGIIILMYVCLFVEPILILWSAVPAVAQLVEH